MQPPAEDSIEKFDGQVSEERYNQQEPREPSIQGRIVEPGRDENEKSVLVTRDGNQKMSMKRDLSPRKDVRRQSRGKSLIQAAKIEKNTTNLDVLKKNVQNFIEGKAYTITMMIVTVYALFGDDIRQFSSTKSTDVVFYVLTIICMTLFTIEIILNCICKPDYILGFYFWLDLIATVSMFLDIGWITDSIFGGSVINGNAKQMKKIGTASKAGRRAGQVIRVIRLVRLVKLYKHANLQLEKENQRREMLKLIEAAQQAEIQTKDIQTNHPQANSGPLIKYQDEERLDEQSKFIDFVKMEEGQGRQSSARGKLPPISKSHTLQMQNQVLSDPPSSKSREDHQFIPPNPSPPRKSKIFEEAEKMNIQPESKVGQSLSDKTMRSVITIILSIVISVPLFNLNTYQDPVSSYSTGLDRIFELQSQNATFNFSFKDYVDFHKGQNEPVIFVFVNLTDTISSCCSFDSQTNYSLFGGDYAMPNDLRLDDTNLYLSFDAEDNLKAYSVTDNRYTTSVNAGLSIIRTIFVSCVLAISAVVFTKDVQTLVLDPIDRMLKKVDRIAKNPLEAAQIEEQEELFLEQLEQQQDKNKIEKQKELQKMETAILEKLIMKIGALLAVGFGEAGSEIIASNMQGGEVDPMLPGKKMMAIFGFCDIRNFTDATEVLQQGVMVFVNEIAEIVHGTVDHYSGAANKNIGDAFLLVWKFRPEDYFLDQLDGKMKLIPSKFVQQLSDFSVISFLKIITGITISNKLVKYKGHPGLNERLPNYSVKMGFGLHLGWAIEGAIGSTYKIDASYLSPNVNMASRLEAATKQFGSSILISGILKKQLSTKCQEHLRHIDTVTVKGSLEPVEIHTVDVSFKNLHAKITTTYDIYDSASLNRSQRKRFRVMNRFKRDKLREEVTQGEKEVSEEFITDPELLAIREPYTKDFYALWEQGFVRYLDGKWAEAAKIFEQTLDYIQDHKDGPSNTLLQVIKEEGGKAPSTWAGFRELTEK